MKILFGNSVEVKGSVKAFKDCLQLKELDIHYKKLTPVSSQILSHFYRHYKYFESSREKIFPTH